MNARKSRDRFDTKPKLNKRGQPVRAGMKGRQPAILQALAQHGTLSINDLHAMFGGNLRALRNSVRVLKDQPTECIRIVAEQVRAHNVTQRLYYQLTSRGVEWLNANGYEAHQPRRVYNLGHTGLVSHIMASITTGVAQHEGAEFVPWDEMQKHPKFPAATIKEADNTAIPHPVKGHIRPDTHPFGIVLPNGEKQSFRFFVVEADNGTETVQPTRPREYKGNSLYAKFEAYLAFIESKGFRDRYGLPNYFVLFVFTSRERMKNAKAALQSIAPAGSRFVLFQATDPDAQPGYIFTTPCERVGFEPLQLNQP
jgi:hypothetical protein